MVKTKRSKKPRHSRAKLTPMQKLKLAVVPHRHNQHRPYLVRSMSLVVMVGFIFAMQAVYNTATTGSVLGSTNDVTMNALVSATNDQRSKHDLAPLRLDSKLSQAAYLKAQDMLQRQYWAHNAPDGTTPWQWMSQVEYKYDYAGENLAKNFSTADGIMTAWLGSPKHRDNVLSQNYKDVGFAVVSGTLDNQPTTIIVAMYGAPATQAVGGSMQTMAAAPTAATGGIDPLTRLGVALQSLTPAALGSMAILTVVMVVAVVAHMQRHKLPQKHRNLWPRNYHGLFKASGALSLLLIVLSLYGGGQI